MESEEYVITLSMDHEHLKIFYTAVEKSWRNWPGGNPYEQMMLKEVKDTVFRTLLESQFSDLK